MKRYLVIFSVLVALLVAVPICSAQGGRGGGRMGGGGRGFGGRGGGPNAGFGHGFGHGFGRNFGGLGLGFGVWDDGDDLTLLYRELLKNVPFYALHPPVYYSYPVPRTYGYSPFAYGPWTMTPDPLMTTCEPLEI